MAPNTITVPPWTVLGYRADGRPIHPIAGGAEGEPVVDSEPEPAEPDDASEPEDDWTPPSREDYEKLVEAHRKASGEAAARRKYLKAHGIDPKTGSRIDQGEPELSEPEPVAVKDQQPQGLSEAETRRRMERAVAEAKIEGMRGAKKLATNFFSALTDAGWNGTRLDLIMPLADLDGADPDDPEDLAERVENVKKLFHEGFTPVKRTRQVANSSNGAGGSGQNGVTPAKVDAADKKPPAPEPKGWAEVLAARAVRG